jgi:hypothetical protein
MNVFLSHKFSWVSLDGASQSIEIEVDLSFLMGSIMGDEGGNESSVSGGTWSGAKDGSIGKWVVQDLLCLVCCFHTIVHPSSSVNTFVLCLTG